MSSGSGHRARLDHNQQLLWLGAAGLLLAALLSVGLLSPSGPGAHPPEDPADAALRASLIRPATASEIDQAIARLMMGGPEKDKAREMVDSGRLRLGWITLSDTQAEDGDWVRLEAAGFRQDVRLLKRPYLVAVPYIPGSSITVTGLVDGSGGNITVAVYANATAVSLRPLSPGEVLQIPTP